MFPLIYPSKIQVPDNQNLKKHNSIVCGTKKATSHLVPGWPANRFGVYSCCPLTSWARKVVKSI